MSHWLVLSILFYCSSVVLLENTGSGAEGNLRLCIVEGRGSYKRGNKYCPILDIENSGIECVIGVDRLDCLRRISKGTVDFGAFSPEDLIAAQWANIDVLVTNEIRQRNRPFARSVAAVVHRSILDGAGDSSVSAILRNRTLCHPATDVDDLKPLSETLTKYVESLVTVDACDPNLSLVENRIKATADYFRIACMAGPWVPDNARDAELKRRYPTLCQACSTGKCLKTDAYWGDSGALNCIGEGIGDVTWAELDDVRAYAHAQAIDLEHFAFLCRNGSSMPLDSPDPCVWLHQPWNVIVAKRKAADAVSRLTASLADSAVTVDRHWRGALAALLEVRQELPAPLQPPKPPMDFLASATGFREAYSQHGCNPPRHITLCTTSILENNKCEWLSEAGAVYGVAPPLQCARRPGVDECMAAVRQGQADAVVANGDWLVRAQRNYSLTPLLHEATPIIDKMSTVSAYVRVNSKINSIEDLRGQRAAFPSFDGLAWHSVLRYLTKKEKLPCKNIANTYFGSVCAPGIEKHNVSEELIERLTKNCYKNGEEILDGEEQALRLLIEGKADVAFLNRNTFNLYMSNHIPKPWAKNGVAIKPVCPEENEKYCFLSWSNIGHLFTSNNLTAMRRHEIINTLTNLDQLFGNHAHRLMFSMYGSFQHELDVLFHNNTRLLITDEMFKIRPYSEIPLNFEKSLNDSNTCIYSDFITDSGVKATSMILLLISLVFSLVLVR